VKAEMVNLTIKLKDHDDYEIHILGAVCNMRSIKTLFSLLRPIGMTNNFTVRPCVDNVNLSNDSESNEYDFTWKQMIMMRLHAIMSLLMLLSMC